jgi:hypothetical protein
MTPGIRIAGDERALALAGAPSASGSAPLTVHLGPPTSAPAAGDVVWLAGSAPDAAPDGARVIATGGDGLWSRAPWPARDELFDAAPATDPVSLVVCADDERREEVVAKLAARGRSVIDAPLLTVEDLTRAAVVALLGDADAATSEAPCAASAVPAEAPAVLAARRILLVPRAPVTFGLLPGTDHLAFGTEDDVVHYVDSALSFPAAFEPFRALGAIAAEHHRASRVYARLAAELTAPGA